MANFLNLIDTHAHIFKEYYPDTEKLIEEMTRSSKIKKVISMATDFETCKEMLDLKMKFKTDDFFEIGLGLHPERIIELGEKAHKEAEKIIELIKANLTLIEFIGEIGLDLAYTVGKESFDLQVQYFKTFSKLAIDIDKPVSIHSRETNDSLVEILQELFTQTTRFNGIIHCFTGTYQQGVKYINCGFKLGLGGLVTFKRNDELRNTIKRIRKDFEKRNINDIFTLETDSPYLSPEPYRGKTNTPENITIINEYLENFFNLN